MPLPAWLVNLGYALVAALVAVAFVPQPRQRNEANDIQRKGVDHDLERVYGTRRLGLVVTDAKVSNLIRSPDDLTPISDVIRSNVLKKGEANSTFGTKKGVLVVEGSCCLSGRLNAAFQGSTPADVNPQVNEKDYDDDSLITVGKFTKGSAFELHLKGGTRHPLSTHFSIGAATNTFEKQVSATAEYFLSLKREIVYSGIPSQTFDLTSNLLYDPRGSDTVGTPSTWTGRADNPVLQLLDYLLDDDFGAGLSVSDFDLSYWETAADIADTPTGTITTTTETSLYSFDDYGTESSALVTKTQTPGTLLESNITLSTSRKISENVEELLAACRGATLFKTRVGKWALQMNWLAEADLTQTFTSETGTGPFAMDWPTANCRVFKNTVLLTSGVDYTITTSNTQTTLYTSGVPGSPTGTDPEGSVGISFTSALIATDTIDIEYAYHATNNPNGIPAMATEFHIVDDPATVDRDYDAETDVDAVDLIRIIDPEKVEVSYVSLDDRYNQCIVKFPDAVTRYKQNQVTWPEEGSATHTAFLAEDNNKKLINDLSINSITTAEKALDYAEFVVRQSRSADVCTVRLDALGLQLDPNDLVKISCKRLNIDAEMWRCVKIVPNADTTVTGHFVRYDAEDFSYAVEAFAQSNTSLINRDFGPVTSVSFTTTVTEGVFGAGVLSWSEPTNGVASSYKVSLGLALVWQSASSYSSGDRVYYDELFYEANATVSPAESAPDVNSKWDEIDEDDQWLEVYNGGARSANVTYFAGDGTYVFKIVPFTPLRNEGREYFHEQAVTRFSFDYEQDLANTPGDGINRILPRYAGNWFNTDPRLPVNIPNDTLDYVGITDLPTLTDVPTSGYYGTHAFKMLTADTLNNDGIVYFGTSATNYNMPIDPNSEWCFRCKIWVYVDDTDVDVKLRTSNSGTFYSPDGGAGHTVATRGQWNDWEETFDLSADSSPSAIIRFDLDSTPDVSDPTYAIWLDGIMLEKKVGDATTASDWRASVGGGELVPAESVIPGALNRNVLQEDAGGFGRAIAKGLQTGFASHNDTITFDHEWEAPPDIVWLSGGIVNDSSSTVGNDAYIVARAINVTTTSFKAQLVLRDPIGSPTTRTDTTDTEVTSDTRWEIKKDQTAEAYNDQYTLTFTGLVYNGPEINDSEPGFIDNWYAPGSATYGIYVAKVADTWIRIGTKTVTGDITAQSNTFTESIVVTVDGVGKHVSASDREFAIVLESSVYDGSTLTGISSLVYETAGSSPTEVSLTPDVEMQYMVIG